MRWEVACSDFGIDALCEEGPRISSKALWHLPEAYQVQQNPEFELFEEEELLGFTASLDFRCGGPEEPKRILTESWTYCGIKSSGDWDFSGTLFLNSGHLSFCFFLPERQMASLHANLLAAVASPKAMNFVMRFNGPLIIGDRSIAVQPELKEKWWNGDCEIGLVGHPKVSLVFGDLVPPHPTWSDLIARHSREI
ncbi:hypothetical protein [Stagnihabitans tardus]|uniref:Uncharacterized protein n=1 Tax=Stagnihabitans tardus TaxID=2699202 RepID=A0AAE4YBX2_9RHOB|nr:hypothetical protein [Stagnihabitans tardus]NBZ87115.1 hypothetical protein [Stagnihabitans tardus]